MLLSAATRALRAPISARTLMRLRAAASRSELEALTVPVLKDRLREQGLKVGGKKNELVERLLESAPAPAAPAPVKQTKPRRGDGRPHANPHNAERCEAEIVSFGPLGASVAAHKSNCRGA